MKEVIKHSIYFQKIHFIQTMKLFALENLVIRRGCTSSFFFNPALSSAETSRTINGIPWCFCNTDNCNTIGVSLIENAY